MRNGFKLAHGDLNKTSALKQMPYLSHGLSGI
jgi:hypothetical protein